MCIGNKLFIILILVRKNGICVLLSLLRASPRLSGIDKVFHIFINIAYFKNPSILGWYVGCLSGLGIYCICMLSVYL